MTFSVELSARPDASGRHSVMLRMHSKGQLPARVLTPVEVERKHWNPKKPWGKWVRSGHLRADTLNTDIESAYNRLKDTVTGWLKTEPHLSPKAAKERYERAGESFERSAEAVHQHSRLALSTIVGREEELKRFLAWAGQSITLEQITPELLRRYQHYLVTPKPTGRGMLAASVNATMARVSAVWSAVMERRGMPRAERLVRSPFASVEPLAAQRRPKARLRGNAITALIEGPYALEWELERGKRGKRGNGVAYWTEWGRWCWGMMYYAAGMRVGDLIRLRRGNIETGADGQPVRLRYQMQKSGKTMSLRLSADARAHLGYVWRQGHTDEYLLPFIDPRQPYARYVTREQIRAMPVELGKQFRKRVVNVITRLNEGVQRAVAERNVTALFGRLTNHSARHSFGDRVERQIKAGERSESNGRVATVFDMQALFGHGALSMTERYRAELSEDSLDEAMDVAFGPG